MKHESQKFFTFFMGQCLYWLYLWGKTVEDTTKRLLQMQIRMCKAD